MTRIFWNGRSQAVRLPQECRFEEGEELVVRRVGRAVVIEPAGDLWARLADALSTPLPELRRPPRDRTATTRGSVERWAATKSRSTGGTPGPSSRTGRERGGRPPAKRRRAR